jgi:hypothetical protein
MMVDVVPELTVLGSNGSIPESAAVARIILGPTLGMVASDGYGTQGGVLSEEV